MTQLIPLSAGGQHLHYLPTTVLTITNKAKSPAYYVKLDGMNPGNFTLEVGLSSEDLTLENLITAGVKIASGLNPAQDSFQIMEPRRSYSITLGGVVTIGFLC